MKSTRPKLGAEIEVYANSAVYRGKLMAITETEIYLKSSTRTWTISLDRVQSFKYVDSKPL